MRLPQALITKILGRFEILIAEGEDIARTAEIIPGEVFHSFVTNKYKQQASYKKLDWPRFVKWRSNSVTLLGHILPKGHVQYSSVEYFRVLNAKDNELEWGINTLKAMKNDLEEGFLDNLCTMTETEIASGDLDMRDLFISHASEDKDNFVRPLAQALIREGVSVWYDEYELTIGDDLLIKINEGLGNSQYGIVVLSPNFFNLKKTWPDREVGALFALEDSDKRSRVLPIWHNVDQIMVASKNPILAGKVAWRRSDFSPDQLAVKFREFMATRRK